MPKAYQINDPDAIYFITPHVVFWIDVFTRKEYRDIVIESLDYCRKYKQLQLYGYVIMSNHLHLIVRSGSGNLSDIIRDFKKFTASTIIDLIKNGNESRKKWLLSEMAYAARKHKRNSNYQFWTHVNHAIELSSTKMQEQRLNYIHNNPVKSGIVANPEDYLYSSARNYCDGMDVMMEIDLME